VGQKQEIERKGTAMQSFISICIVSLVIVITGPVRGDLIRIPEDFSTIQAGIDQAQALDTVLVAPGVYNESLVFNGKTLILASWYLTNPDSSFVRSTVIDGNDGDAVIFIDDGVGPQTAVIGFTIQNADDGIAANGKFNLLNNRIIECGDGIDYEDTSGGLCRENLFEYNSDDAIDLDDYIDVVIEKNIIRYNDDDGIEIRLEDYSGLTLVCVIRSNDIYGNGEDGIQLIDYQELSDRTFIIDHNLIYNNEMAGLGCMSNENTEENYEGAAIKEPVYLYNNTFAGNSFGVSGGAHLVALNNIFIQHSDTAMKNVNGHSIVAHSVLWENGVDLENCNADTTVYHINPLLDDDFSLLPGSPCIDKGIAYFVWQDSVVLDLPPAAFQGDAPDIGAREYLDPATALTGHESIPAGIHLFPNFPNPFNPKTIINYELQMSNDVDLSIFNLLGQKIATLVHERMSAGIHQIEWDARVYPSGVYYYRLSVGKYHDIRKMILIK